MLHAQDSPHGQEQPGRRSQEWGSCPLNGGLTLLLSGNPPHTFSEFRQHLEVWHDRGLELRREGFHSLRDKPLTAFRATEFSIRAAGLACHAAGGRPPVTSVPEPGPAPP